MDIMESITYLEKIVDITVKKLANSDEVFLDKYEEIENKLLNLIIADLEEYSKDLNEMNCGECKCDQ